MTEPREPAGLSTPQLSKISLSWAMDALPEIGRSKRRGISCTGKSSAFVIGASQRSMQLSRPQVRSIETPQTSIRKTGNSCAVCRNPVAAPSAKASKLFCLHRKNSPMPAKSRGRSILVRSDIHFIDGSCSRCGYFLSFYMLCAFLRIRCGKTADAYGTNTAQRGAQPAWQENPEWIR